METNEPGWSDAADPEHLVGSIFAGRYRLTRMLSAGANTIIYDADDAESRRPVTVKVIQPDLAASEEFRIRFDRTIRSVASLSHPNIAAVYDWGDAQFRGAPTTYVAIEQLRAGSVRDLYDRGRRLSPSQALAVGLDACRALDHAHRRGFVHAELTPSKMVFGDDRRLRIVDFGLAALLSEAAWAEPATVPTHVARYASPEQALSLPIAGSTDVYALCLTLVEGVTGVLPFAADSTVATLAARVGKLMPVSADLGPLAAVLERAGRPHADERSTASQFGQSLVQAAEKLPRPEPLPLLSTGLFDTPLEHLRTPEDPTGGVARPPSSTGAAPAPDAEELLVVPLDEPDGDEPDLDESDGAESDGDESDLAEGSAAEVSDVPEPASAPVLLDPGLMSAAAARSPEVAPEPLPEPAETLDPVAPVEHPLPPDPMPVAAPVIAQDVAPDDAADDAAPRSRRTAVLWKVVLALLLLAALVGLAVLAVRLFSTPTYDVPELGGLERDAALAVIAEFEWDVTVETERSDAEPRPDLVVRTVPVAGDRVARGEPFLVVVSEGPEFRTLPELEGLTFVEAEARLIELALEPSIDQAFDEDVPRGGVVSWSVPGQPELVAGGQVLPGTEVDIIASLGPAPRNVPDLANLTASAATAALAELRLEIELGEQVFDDVVPPGLIVSQSPEPGSEVQRGATVTVVVSRGPDLVVLPELEGLTFAEAQSVLVEAGFTARLVLGASDGQFVSATIDGEPANPGAPYRRGSQVDLVFL